MAIAYNVAHKSNDPRTQVGSVVLSESNDGYWNVIGKGYNKILADIDTHPERFIAPEKYDYVDHAEVRSISDASCNKYGDILVATWAACSGCAKGIIGAGIKTVITDYRVFLHADEITGDGEWNNSIHAALNMFEENGVEFHSVIPDISGYNCKPIKIAGELFQP